MTGYTGNYTVDQQNIFQINMEFQLNSLPLITGDFLYNVTEGYGILKCENGLERIESYLNEKKIWYSIDCKLGESNNC